MSNIKTQQHLARILLSEIESYFAQNQIHEVDMLLTNIEPRQYGIHAAIGIVKSTHRAKNMLLNWESMFDKTKKYLSDEGYNPEEIFFNMK